MKLHIFEVARKKKIRGYMQYIRNHSRIKCACTIELTNNNRYDFFVLLNFACTSVLHVYFYCNAYFDTGSPCNFCDAYHSKFTKFVSPIL